VSSAEQLQGDYRKPGPVLLPVSLLLTRLPGRPDVTIWCRRGYRCTVSVSPAAYFRDGLSKITPILMTTVSNADFIVVGGGTHFN
jgi:hypothetical protein